VDAENSNLKDGRRVRLEAAAAAERTIRYLTMRYLIVLRPGGAISSAIN
jgi:hypothetical protein